MKCINCGNTIPSVSLVCPHCQNPVEQNVSSAVNFGDVNDVNYGQDNDIVTGAVDTKKKKKIIVFASVLVAFVLLFIIILIVVFSSSKGAAGYELYTNKIMEVTEYLVDGYLGNASTKSGDYTLTFDIDTKNGNVEREFNGNYQLDIRNKIFALTGKMRDPKEQTGEIIVNSKNLVFDAYMRESNLYLKSNQVYGDKYVLLPIEDETGLLTTKNYDLTTLVEGISESLVESLKSVRYDNSTEEITYRGKKTRLNKKSLVLDNENKKVLLLELYRNLLDDSNFVNELARVRDEKPDNIRKTLENYSKTAEYAYSGISAYKTVIDVYYKGLDIYRIEVLFDEENISDEVWRLDIGDTKDYITCFKNNKSVLDATLVKVEKEYPEYILKTYDITFDTDDFLVDATLKVKDSKKVVVKKQEITNYKNIRDFTSEDYTIVRSYMSDILEDTSWLEKFGELFQSKCSKAINCACEDETCTCKYENNGKSELITCPKSEVVVEPIE